MDLADALGQLAEQNLSGVAFLSAYGLTWLVCAVFWSRASQRTAAYATLFQGMVAFPIALGLSALIGAIGQSRPVPDEITQLSILIGTSRYLSTADLSDQQTPVRARAGRICHDHRGALRPIFVAYQTPLYIGMAV